MSEARTGGFGRLLTGAAWTALLLALWLRGHDIAEEPISPAPRTGDAAAARSPARTGLPPAHGPLPGAGPQQLAIDAIGLTAPIEGHGLDPRGGVETPPFDRPNSVSWYQGGPQPGSEGAAILVGHVDTDKAPAVFYEIRFLKPGSAITVTRNDGTTARFTVEDVALVDKDHFDDDKVYGPHDPGRAELRLITCGGAYDRAHHEYAANVVVSAYLTGAAAKPAPAAPPPPAPPAPHAPPAPPAPPRPPHPPGGTNEQGEEA
ncbi:class F sortase [Streptoverticillium reticulum]|uniref:class F sortase n=1 Tax=Streptoverticillium reticulum TaxID=1433415 RepID=UPI0039BF2710